MRRDRVVDGAGIVLVALALLMWWAGLPAAVDPALGAPRPSSSFPPEVSEGAARVAQVARQALVALLITGAIAVFGVAATGWRSRWRPAVVAPLVLVVAGLAAARLVSAVLYRTEALRAPDATLVGLTPPAAVAAVLVASTGLALLLAGAPSRPLAVVAGLLGVAAVATVAEEALLWWLFGSRTMVDQVLRFLTVHALVGFLVAAALVAFAVGVRRPAGSLAREAAVGAIVLWGAVVVVLQVVSSSAWREGQPYGMPQAALDPAEPYSLGVLTLLAAPAAALLVARMRARPGREAVTMRWRGACIALALLLFAQVTMPLGLLLIMWPERAMFTQELVLWLVLSGAAAIGFALAALRRDAGPAIAVVAALLAVSSVGLGPAGGLWGEAGPPFLGEPMVLGMLAPLVVALAVAFRALSARRGRDDTDPAEPTQPAVPV